MSEITKQESEQKLKSSENILNKLGINKGQVMTNPHAKKPVDEIQELDNKKRHLSPEERLEVAVRKQSGEKTKNLAAEFGLTGRQINNVASGTVAVPVRAIEKVLNRIEDLAAEKINDILEAITEDDIVNSKPIIKTQMAMNLSKVLNIRGPRGEGNDGAPPQIMIYAPQTKAEGAYKTIDV